MKRVFKGLFLAIVMSLFAFLLVIQIFGSRVKVDGMSMSPSLNDKQSGFVLYEHEWLGEISLGDMVMVQLKDGSQLVKRVVALPGQTIESYGGILIRDGEGVFEPYLDQDYINDVRGKQGIFNSEFPLVTLGEDEYFVLGDNRSNSLDSRSFGPVHKDQILSHNFFWVGK